MKLLIFLLVTLFLRYYSCTEQICRFGDASWTINGNDGPSEQLYICSIENPSLLDDTEAVTTQTSTNRRPNADVKGILYCGARSQVKFLPKSIFTVFQNVHYISINPNQGIETLKPEYFKNAKSLKVFKVMNNDIKVLVDNVFAEANNLEFIVMFDCKLETIQRFAFNGLTKIRRIYLHQNRISTLHSQTFSQLSNLNYISLSGNTCIDKTFVNANQKFVEIENEISKFCKLSLNNENLTNKWKTYDEKLNNSDAIIQDLIKTIKNLQEAMKYLEQNCTNSTSLIQLMKDQKEEIYNTCECQNNLIDVRFNN